MADQLWLMTRIREEEDEQAINRNGDKPFGVDMAKDPDKLHSGVSDALVVVLQCRAHETVDFLFKQDASLVPHQLTHTRNH